MVWLEAVSGDGKLIVSGFDDKTLRRWDGESGESIWCSSVQCVQDWLGHNAGCESAVACRLVNLEVGDRGPRPALFRYT